MGDKNKQDKINSEDSTKYGEFISSYFAWMSLDKQKEVADKLKDITKDKE